MENGFSDGGGGDPIGEVLCQAHFTSAPRPELGDVPPDQYGISDRRFTRDPAVSNNAGTAWSWGPQLPFVIQACAGAKILGQVSGDHEPLSAAAFSILDQASSNCSGMHTLRRSRRSRFLGDHPPDQQDGSGRQPRVRQPLETQTRLREVGVHNGTMSVLSSLVG